jgi:apolipoprotein N-acyltransferase
VNLALSLASGLMLVLIFPRWNLVWLAPVALAPLIAACAREARWKRRFLLGWASGGLFWFFVCTWIQFVLEVHGGMGRWGGWGAFLLFALLKGLHTALFATLAGVLLRSRWAALLVPALWTGIEYAHGSLGLAWLGLGFAWLQLGNAGADLPSAMRLAPVTGVYGLTFVFAMLGCGVALLAIGRPWRQISPLALLAGLFLLPGSPPLVEGNTAVQVVQPNIDTLVRPSQEIFTEIENRLRVLSLRGSAALIVWPEVPFGFYPEQPRFRNYLSEIARQAGTPLLMGGVAFSGERDPLNSAFLFDASGQPRQRYDKIRLVPFGEYIPPAFGWVNRITREAGDFKPGLGVVTMNVDGHSLGAFICYESAFPSLVRQFTARGAKFLVNLSNDGYFGDSAAREQHLELVRMRAAENRRWILRSTNDGITAMIDPAGRVTERLPGFVQTATLMTFRYLDEMTPYVRYGDWFAWLCWAFSMGGLALPKQPK